MPKFRQTAEILRLMSKKEIIRNVGIVAHIDHGKTTMTDSLLIEAGLLPPQITGSVRALDYLEEEQRRGITIKTANISLLHKKNHVSYVINLVDTPGHVDFTGKVARAMRAIDGAVVVVDAVEEIMAQTETVTRQALEERVRPVLFINKIDRLITEMQLSTDAIQKKFSHIIDDFNSLIEVYAEPELKRAWKVDAATESVAFGSALHKWGFTLDIVRKKGIKFSGIVDAYGKKRQRALQKVIPLHDAILDMAVRNVPSPVEAQKYRVPKIWKGDVNSEVGRAMLNCDDSGPTVICVTAAQTKPEGELIVAGRLFSGRVRKGDCMHLVGADSESTVEQVAMYMGAYREDAEQITAGNIAALTGLNAARAGETLVDSEHKRGMTPFERVRYVSEPVLTVAIEPKNPLDIPRLTEALSRLAMEDPNLTATVNPDTGEHLLSGMGELHLEVIAKTLKEYSGGIEITTSEPTVVYRETVTAKGKITTAREHGEDIVCSVQVEPADKEVASMIEKGEWPTEKDETVWAMDVQGNLLINATKKDNALLNVKDTMVAGFREVCRRGPLCGEPLRDVEVKLVTVQLCEDRRRDLQERLTKALRRAVFDSFLTAKPALLEPIYKLEITASTVLFGRCSIILARKRGKILETLNKGAVTTISGYVPVAETFDLSSEMRSATSGRAFWQNMFDHWERVPETLAYSLIGQIRERKGLEKDLPRLKQFADGD